MGLTSSYEKFMRSVATSGRFHAQEADGLDDTAEFSRLLKLGVERGLVEVDRRDVECFYVYKKEGKTMNNKEAIDSSVDALTATDNRSKAVQKTPWRVSLASMERRIVSEEYINPDIMPHMTICLIKLDNGYVLLGKSTPVDAANFDEKLGREYAYEDALCQMWPLEAYAMRDHLSGQSSVAYPDQRWA